MPVIGNRGDDAIDILAIEQFLIAPRDGQIRIVSDLPRMQMAPVIKVRRAHAFDAGNGDRGREQIRALHTDADVPKRTRSLGAVCLRQGAASRRIVFAAHEAGTGLEKFGRTGVSFFYGLNGNFLEEDDVIVAVILQADIAEVRTQAALRFESELLGRDRRALSCNR